MKKSYAQVFPFFYSSIPYYIFIIRTLTQSSVHLRHTVSAPSDLANGIYAPKHTVTAYSEIQTLCFK